ncbi:cytochrome P450 [Colletotrichum sublineola]|nr:cytochrome P450 [Colletotrichum sublineola]
MVISDYIPVLYSKYVIVVLPAIIIVLRVIRLIWTIVYNAYFHPLCVYPGPKHYAAMGFVYPSMIISGKGHKTLAELHKKYGPVVRLGPDTIDWADPRAFKDLLGQSSGVENYKDPTFTTRNSYGIVYAGQEDHARIRRVLAPGFSGQHLVKQEPLIQKYFDLLIQRLHENCEDGKKALNMVSWYNYTTFDIIGDLAFGEPFGCLEKSDFHPWVSSMFGNLLAKIYKNQLEQFWITRPFTDWLIPKKLKEKEKLHRMFSKDKIERRMASGESRPDFIQFMMEKDGALAMSKPEIEGTADSFIIGGSDTTGTSLSGATFFLTTHPDAMAKLVEEVRSSFSSEQEINIASVQKLRYLQAVLNESMRLYPVLPLGYTRIIKPGGDYICERYVPEGTRVIVSQWPMYRNDKYFAQPDEFIPERFLDDPRFKDDDTSAIHAFGYGPRNCIGRNLAMSEMRVILARVIWNFDLQIADNSRNWMEQKLYTLWKKGPLHVHLTPRKQG